VNTRHQVVVAIVGRGRMGSALAAALAEALVTVDGPFGRGFDGTQASGRSDRSGATKGHYDIVLLAVPDAQIATAAATIVAGPLVGHCAGSMGLDVLGDRESFSVHPLMTVTAEGAEFTGAGAAVAGSTGRALMVARDIALALGMSPVEISECDRAAYHAAASIASNFLVTLEDAAERLLATTGADRALLVPLVRAAVENWAAVGGPAALTGPVARGDEATVARQRAAIAARLPDLLDLFDTLAAHTAALARRR
jgi:predicted short-subunit dehydrogenase-like oxidoreductase (DUF2520 family)